MHDINVVQFSIDLFKRVSVFKKSQFQNLVFNSLKLSETIRKTINTEKEKQPFNLNVIDELRASENAHSRIFAKLLAYKEKEKYPFLEEFVLTLGEGFESIQIKSPSFSVEKQRIDVLISDLVGKFAIIIENKIHGAIDQPDQIENYIEKMKKNFSLDQIYVIYMTRTGGSPSEYSFYDSSKTNFNERYIEINYKEDVLPFIEYSILPLCRVKEQVLYSGLLQYIDHLKGIFNLRINDKDMNKIIDEHIEKSLELNNDWIENLEKINSSIKGLYDTISYLEDYKKSGWFTYWHKKMKEDFPDEELLVSFDNLDKYPKIGIIFQYKSKRFACLIEAENSKTYYGLGRHECSDKLDSDVEQFLKENLNQFNNSNNYWYGYQFSNHSAIYELFKELANKINKLILTLN